MEVQLHKQLAKNTFFTQKNKEIVRKVAEGFMALDYEKIILKMKF